MTSGTSTTSSGIPLPRRSKAEVEWARAGATTDPSLPVATPAVQAILDRLPTLPDGSVVLDLACGVGQPTFALARSRPRLEVLGVDATRAVIELARLKARENQVRNARFEVMSLDRLELADGSAHAAVSHFGLLQEGDITSSVHELSRVLVAGAPFSVAAFDDMALNTFMSTIEQALHTHVPQHTLPDLDYLTRLAAPGLRERLLREAGLGQVESELLHWSVPVPSFEALWQLATGPVPFGTAFDTLDHDGREYVRRDLEEAASRFRTEAGGYLFPMAYRMFWGHR